ncbi:PREDICTED: O-acyltransferase WSD1-like isoform X1 [Populus euphratica]|uniref:O-acyltransferase WSD1-like isoform X1 n=1 Tax=Populus euphratica TaxID=75702 RepID=A0AAJ6T076_POPEU|nr:PREDICTED: O-acyltransferase WSD1-like isoform X1 [Populus euphratica]
MEIVQDQEISEPVSPSGQFLSSSILSLSIIAVMEFEAPFDNSQAIPFLKDVFLPINPRFSSIMVADKDGVKRWKRVEVRLTDHVNFPVFTTGMSTQFYDECFDEYLSKMAMEQLPQSQPLWEVHIINYPTSHAASNIIFKLHHSLGDGFSLMGALLSCLQRADAPPLPLTFPSVQLHTNTSGRNCSMFRKVPRFFSSVYNTASDFCSSIIQSCLVKDDKTPIRSGHSGVEFLPVAITTMTFSLDQIKQIKAKLGVTINDVITGIIFLGARMYMETVSQGSGSACSTSLVLLNTRMHGGYKSIQEMVKPDAESPWGNHFAFLNVRIPKLRDAEAKNNPLKFILNARKIIKKKRTSFGVNLTAKYLQLVAKFRGPNGASKYIYGTMENTSMGISNVRGPMEQMALANNPINGLYFVVTGAPQSLVAGVTSYVGKLRVALLVEKDFIDPRKLKSHTEKAFDMIFEAACRESTQQAT